MGLLSSVVKTVKTVFTSPVKSFSEGAKAVSAITAAPVTTITKGLAAGQAQVKQQGILTSSIKSVATLGTIAAGVVGGGVAAGSGTAVKLSSKAIPLVVSSVKSVAPKTAKGKVITAIAAPIAVGAFVSQPAKTTSTLLSAPSELGKFGADVANFVSEPSVEKAKEIVKESPLISAAVGAAVVGGAGKLISPIIGGALQREAIQEQTEVLKTAVADSSTLPPATTSKATTAPVAQAALTPVTSPTGKISSGVTKSKRKRIKPSNNVSQRVNIILQNKNTSYLNRKVFN